MKTFYMAAQDWLDSKLNIVKNSTYKMYEYLCYERIIPLLGDETLSEITETHLSNVVRAYYIRKLSINYIRDIIRVIKDILINQERQMRLNRWFIENKFQTQNTNYNIEFPYKKLVKTLLTETQGAILFGVLLTSLTGLRIGELCALKLRDFNLEDDTINVSKTLQRVYSVKTKNSEVLLTSPKSKTSIRLIPLPGLLKKQIAQLIASYGKNNYLTSLGSNPNEPRTVRREFHCFINANKLPHIRFHDLRHLFAKQMVELKIDYKVLSMILGHASITTTLDLYVNVGMKTKKKGIRVLTDWLMK